MGFWTVSNILGMAQIVVVIIGGIAFFLQLRYEHRVLRHDFRNIEQRQKILDEKFEALEREIREDMDTNRHQNGETIAAIRSKVNEVELFVRDNFVRKDTFNVVMLRLESDVKGIGDRIETRLLRMEAKIDTKT